MRTIMKRTAGWARRRWGNTKRAIAAAPGLLFDTVAVLTPLAIIGLAIWRVFIHSETASDAMQWALATLTLCGGFSVIVLVIVVLIYVIRRGLK